MQVSLATLVPYLMLLLLALFLGLWSVASILSSRSSGWHALAKRFRTQSDPSGEVRKAGPFLYGVYIRYWTDYSGAIRIASTKDALYLSVLLPLRIGHPPLCIPWNEIQISETRLLWVRFVVLTLGSQERMPMRISERIAGKLGIMEGHSNEALPE
jgi:hypothetical protein